MWLLGNKSGSLEEQPVPLTAEQSLQSKLSFSNLWILKSVIYWKVTYFLKILNLLPGMNEYLARNPSPSSSSSELNLIHMNLPVDLINAGLFMPQ